MHLIIGIALGIFGGLWLFTKWGEWRERRAAKRIERAADRAALARYQQLQQAAGPAPKAEPAPPQMTTTMMATGAVFVIFLLVAAFAISHPRFPDDWITAAAPTASTGPWTHYAAHAATR